MRCQWIEDHTHNMSSHFKNEGIHEKLRGGHFGQPRIWIISAHETHRRLFNLHLFEAEVGIKWPDSITWCRGDSSVSSGVIVVFKTQVVIESWLVLNLKMGKCLTFQFQVNMSEIKWRRFFHRQFGDCSLDKYIKRKLLTDLELAQKIYLICIFKNEDWGVIFMISHEIMSRRRSHYSTCLKVAPRDQDSSCNKWVISILILINIKQLGYWGSFP